MLLAPKNLKYLLYITYFLGQLQITCIQDPGATGNFEVVVLESGDLIHSKRNGAGKCETPEERDILFDKIRHEMKIRN
jgi:hypothetical protein